MSGGGGSITISLNGLFVGVLVIAFFVVGYFAVVGWKRAIAAKWNALFEKRQNKKEDSDDDDDSSEEEEEKTPKPKKRKNVRN